MDEVKDQVVDQVKDPVPSVEEPPAPTMSSTALSTTLTVDSAVKVKRIVSLLRGLSRPGIRERGLVPDRATIAAFAELPRHERRAALARLRSGRARKARKK